MYFVFSFAKLSHVTATFIHNNIQIHMKLLYNVDLNEVNVFCFVSNISVGFLSTAAFINGKVEGSKTKATSILYF